MDTSTTSIPALIRSVLDDTRELIREEIAVARAEIREEATAAQAVAAGFAAAALTGLVAVVLLCVAIGGAIADLFDWPTWAGYGIVAILLAIAAYMGVRYGRSQLATLHALPKTSATLRENIEWIQNKSNSR